MKKIALPNIVSDTIATYIGIETINGVHYFNVLKEEKNLLEYVRKLQNTIVQMENGTQFLKIKEVNGGKIIIFDIELCELAVKAQLEQISQQYSEFKQIVEFIDIEKSKQKEMDLLVEEITRRRKTFDVYLYKAKGQRKKTMAVTIGNEKCKKVINGYRLTIEDIVQVNKMLGKYGLKVTNVKECEMLDRDDGLRVSLEIGKADYVE